MSSTTDYRLIEQISIVPTLLDVVSQTTGMRFVAIAKVTEQKWITCSALDKIAFGLKPGDELPLETTICNEIRQHKELVVIDHVDEDPIFCHHHTPALYKFQSYISVPIFLKNGEFFGTLCAIDPSPNKLNTPTVINMFELYTNLIALHIGIEEEKKRNEKQLEEAALFYEEIAKNEAKLGIVLETSELGFWEIQVKERTIEFSERFMEISGYTDPTALTLDEIVKQTHPDDVQTRLNAYEKALTTGELYYMGRIIWPDASIHWIESKGKAFFKNKEATHILGVTRDITAEKEAEQVLIQSETKFRLLADSMPQHVWLGDPAGNLYFFNKHVYDFSGLSPQQIEKDGWLQIVHPNDREENIRLWMESVTTGKEFEFEHRFRKHDGSYKWQLSRAVPQIDAQGKIQMWVGLSADIQVQKDLTDNLGEKIIAKEEELLYRASEISKMSREIGNLAFIASHDLQEPLRKIQTFAKLINATEQENLSEKGKDYFSKINNSAARMQALIADLMTYSHLSHYELKYVLTDLNIVLEEVKTDLKDELLQKQATIKASNLNSILLIPFQIRQLFHNLITNSLKYAKLDVAPVIVIKTRIVSGSKVNDERLSDNVSYCHIIFSDNGIGFEQMYSEKIFELFQRLHDKKQYSGTGIGLAIVKKIVENHKGFINAVAAENEGATFNIYLPL